MTLATYLVLAEIGDADFAKKIGSKRYSVYRWRVGDRIPDREFMRKIREATNGAVTANDFYDEPEKAVA